MMLASKRRCLAVVLAISGTALAWASPSIDVEDFENGMTRWSVESSEQVSVIQEPGLSNHVLLLKPVSGGFVHAVFEPSRDWRNTRMEGRFLFPEQGDGYLGFIYNLQQTEERQDFGCLYVKSNGSYVRVSPHHDGNPSWRLYEELKFDLVGERRIRVGYWHRFRLDVVGRGAALYIDNMDEPVVRFDLFPNTRGALGLEARPGGGAPVWVDDLRFSRLDEPIVGREYPSMPADQVLDWEVLGPFEVVETASVQTPDLPEQGWQLVQPDARGLVNTGLTTQFRSGDRNIAYLRTRFTAAEGESNAPTWLAISSANRLDVWFNGYYRGTVADERFIWSDFLTAADHPGARVPLQPVAGVNEIIVRVHGRRFAGGGLFAALVRPNRMQVDTQD